MIEHKIFQHLSTSTVVCDVVGTRIYPIILPQNPTLPAITFTRISGGQINGISGYHNLQNPHIQIDTWATSWGIARTLSTRIHTAMSAASAFSAVLVSDLDIYEEDSKLFRTIMDFSVWNKE